MSPVKPSRYHSVLQLALVAVGGIALSVSAQEVALVNNGVSEFRLVLAEEPVPEEVLAAEELRHFLAVMSGAELPDAGTQEDEPKLYLGRASAFSSAPVEGSALGAEACLIEGRGKDLYVLGGSGRAVLWAVYGLLHELGCRWYMPGEIGEVVPKQSTITVDGRRRVSSPDFPYRQIWYSWAARRTGASGSPSGNAGTGLRGPWFSMATT